MKEIIEELILKHQTISTMESATGGFIAHSITNVEGASEVFSFGAVTYSNQYKVQFGVFQETIDQYSVYSRETAWEMSRAISDYTGSTYGVGITGKLNRADKNNLYGEDNVVYVSVYDSEKNTYWSDEIVVEKGTREENKEEVLESAILLLKRVILEKEA